MENEKKQRKCMADPFVVLAMKDAKSKETAKEGTLSDLFECTDSLAQAAKSLALYAQSISDGTKKAQLDGHLKMLGDVLEGLLRLAADLVKSDIASVASPAPELAGQEAEVPAAEREVPPPPPVEAPRAAAK
jgi:hypothetical protein